MMDYYGFIRMHMQGEIICYSLSGLGVITSYSGLLMGKGRVILCLDILDIAAGVLLMLTHGNSSQQDSMRSIRL